MNEEVSDQARTTLHKAISDTREEETAEGVLVSAVVVAEWITPEGDRWISRISTTDGGDRTPPPWTTDGLLHYALHGDWSVEDE